MRIGEVRERKAKRWLAADARRDLWNKRMSRAQNDHVELEPREPEARAQPISLAIVAIDTRPIDVCKDALDRRKQQRARIFHVCIVKIFTRVSELHRYFANRILTERGGANAAPEQMSADAGVENSAKQVVTRSIP